MDYGLLERSPEQLAAGFAALKTRGDVAALLEYREKDLNYWATHAPEFERYRTFKIAKRSGGSRQIAAPNPKLRLIQRRLNQVLRVVARPRSAAHGFVDGKSVVTNAGPHVGRRTVFNVDLEDFFGSIGLWRVRGLFASKPFLLPLEVATLLAQICCFRRRLPQGAPTSPVISNMICLRLDRMMTALAKSCRCTYTRYGDDMTFSTKASRPPAAIAKIVEAPAPHIEVGDELHQIIVDNGFSVNSRKVRLLTRRVRQEVTGVIVNERLNVDRNFVRDVRAMLHAWDKHGLSAAEARFHQQYLKQKHIERPPRFNRYVRGKLDYLGMVRGQEDPLFIKLLRWYHALDGGAVPSALKRYDAKDEILRLGALFQALAATDNRRGAGFKFQDLLHDLLRVSQLAPGDPFKTREGGEQIDGSFAFQGETYLLEAKWHREEVNNADVYPFCFKVAGKADFTRGLFIAVNGYSQPLLDVITRGKPGRVVLMDRTHLERVFAKRETFAELLRRAERHLAERGEPYMKLDS